MALFSPNTGYLPFASSVSGAVNQTDYLLNMNEPYTAMAWLNLVAANNTVVAWLMYSANSSGTEADGLYPTMTGSGATSWVLRTNNATTAYNTGFSNTWTLGVWRHVTIMRSSPSLLTAYFDGVSVATQTRNTSGQRTAGVVAWFGIKAVSAGGWAAAHMKIWNQALAPEQIHSEMWSESPIMRKNLISHQPFLGQGATTFSQSDFVQPNRRWAISSIQTVAGPILRRDTKITPMVWWMPPAAAASAIPNMMQAYRQRRG